MNRIDSEFNQERITNVDSDLSFEFGNTPRGESQSKADNSYDIRDEVNDNPSINTEEPKEEEKKRREDKKDEDTSSKDNKDLNNTNNSSSSGSGAGSSASAASSTGAAVASTAAAVAAAALVSVATLSNLVGIDVYGDNSNIHPTPEEVEIAYVVPWSNKVGCRLYLSGNDNDKYVAYVSLDGETVGQQELTNNKNEFYITQLSPETTYELGVKNLSQDTLLQTTEFTTIAENGVYPMIDADADVEEGTFEIILAYKTSDSNFGDFELHLRDSEENEKFYSLDMTDGFQSVKLNQEGDDFIFSFDDPNGFTYEVIYYYEQEEMHSQIGSVIFNTSAEIVKYTITMNAGDPSTEDPISYTLREGKQFILPENPFEIPEGYVFKAWKYGRVEYNPGVRLSSYITKDYEITALFTLDPTPVVNSITFSNEIDFTEESNLITVTMDYTDPEYMMHGVKIILYNPDPDRRQQNDNIVLEFNAKQGSQEVTLTEYERFRLCTGDQIEYEISYSTYLGDDIIYESSTVTFVDSEGGEAHVDSFELMGITYDDRDSEYTMDWSTTYTYEGFGDRSFYENFSIEFVPDGAGDTVTVTTSGLPASGNINSFTSTDYSSLNFGTGKYSYTFSVNLNLNRKIVLYTGYVDMSKNLTSLSNFAFDSEYYVVNGHTYAVVSMDVADYSNSYGDLTLTVYDNTDPTGSDPQSYEASLYKISGKQVVDLGTSIPSSILETAGSAVYTVTGSTAQYTLAGPDDVGELSQPSLLVTEYFAGHVSNRTVYEDNLYFDLGLLRLNKSTMGASLSNLKLRIVDSGYSANYYDIPADVSDFTEGFHENRISVSSTYEYLSNLLNTLKTRKVDLKVVYDCTENGATDTIILDLCSETIFSVR